MTPKEHSKIMKPHQSAFDEADFFMVVAITLKFWTNTIDQSSALLVFVVDTWTQILKVFQTQLNKSISFFLFFIYKKINLSLGSW